MVKKLILPLLMLVVMSGCGTQDQNPQHTPIPPEPTHRLRAATSLPQELPTVEPTLPPIPTCIGTQNYQEAQVVKVIDGDTIDVDINGTTERVRYIGIDAPEMDASNPNPGNDAFLINQDLVEDKTVRLLKGDTNKDDFGRLLRFVLVDEVFVNQRLLAVGAATSFIRPDQTYCVDYFNETQYEAFQTRRGIWGAIAASYEVEVGDLCPDGCKSHERKCDIKGNISRAGDKIFHIPGDSEYDITGISPSKGERWFCTIDEAIRNGWRPPRAE
jgi:micrococcal nuclease